MSARRWTAGRCRAASSSLMSDASVKRAGGERLVAASARCRAASDRASTDRRACTRSPTAQLRQDRFLLLELRRRIVAAFDVRAAEAGELDRLAARGEDAAFAARPACAGDLDASSAARARPPSATPSCASRSARRSAARRDRGRRSSWLRRQAEVGRPDRLVRFLRVLHLASGTGAGRRSTRRRTSRGSRAPIRSSALSLTASSSRCGDR